MNSFPIPSNMHFPAETEEKSESNSTDKEREECKREGSKNTTYTLKVSDNGVGIPEGLDLENTGSLGLQLVTTLVDQLDGEFEPKRNNGTRIRYKVHSSRKINEHQRQRRIYQIFKVKPL